jgi:hypothetical protein
VLSELPAADELPETEASVEFPDAAGSALEAQPAASRVTPRKRVSQRARLNLARLNLVTVKKLFLVGSMVGVLIKGLGRNNIVGADPNTAGPACSPELLRRHAAPGNGGE